MILQRCDQRLRQHRDPVLGPLTVAHDNLGPLEIHILHPQSHALHQPHSRSIKQTRHQAMDAIHAIENRRHLLARQHHRQALRLLGADDLVEPGQIDIQHLAVKKQQGRQRLILRRRRHPPLHRKMSQKSLNLDRPHLARVALAVEEDEAFYPLKILCFGADAVMLDAQAIAHLVEQFWWRGLGGGFWHNNFNKPLKFNELQTIQSLYTPLAG